MGGFKKFLLRGNVIDLAVAVVIGAAFTAVVNAFVRGMINPLVGAVGTKNLDDYKTCLKGPCATDGTGEVTDGVFILWGSVLGALLTFTITAAVVYFIFVMPVNHLLERRARALGQARKQKLTDNELLTQIRDLLAKQNGGEGNGEDGATDDTSGPGGTGGSGASVGGQRRETTTPAASGGTRRGD
ncbi:large conductance mechanosensitive channel protein MscL [Yinghuangia sp. ASG 101]|uniref:large conductance mechanosensitive channel protein MscL n=1 Tax=Yinghuangia sp. ASG 101 TaxID=2896848 RepID=UPI001E370EDC|nr:large conductance mechanosensitive channel protein MscL [Yinghuangia sp. ASG 101]UGQ09323.1 large conductance mechanosensitive channel protein MscL [Yinghuangia sp. ASG 101]